MTDERTETITVTPQHIDEATEGGKKQGGLRTLLEHLGHDFDDVLKRNQGTLDAEARARGFDSAVFYRDTKENDNAPVQRGAIHDAHVFPGTQLTVAAKEEPAAEPEPTTETPTTEEGPGQEPA